MKHCRESEKKGSLPLNGGRFFTGFRVMKTASPFVKVNGREIRFRCPWVLFLAEL